MARTQFSALFVLSVITVISGQCLVEFQNGTVSNNGSTCTSFSQSTFSNTTTCSWKQLSDSSQGNLTNIKAFTDAAFDLYSLLRSRLDVSHVVNYINQVRTKGPIVGSLKDVDFARLWFQVKLSPHLSSLSRDTLSCLSQSNLTCMSFQELVKDLSLQIGPARQRMVYQNFIKPFLARNTADAGCVNSTSSAGEWLQLNFQTFSASASLRDFIALNPKFDGLLVLDKLTPEQKAELIFRMEESAKLNLSVITQIFQSVLPPLTNMPLYTANNLSDFLVSLRPLGIFIRACMNISQTTVSNIRNETIQHLVNWAMNFDNQISINNFSISNFSDWLHFVVLPVMKKSLQANQILSNYTAFDSVFPAEPEITEPIDNCKVTSNNSSCHTSQIEENLAKTINCVAQSNLRFTEEDLKLLITELSRSLQMEQSRAVTNSSQSNLSTLFAELPAESFTSGNLEDPDFMSFWFQIKMKPLLPEIPREFLSCINTRAFSCQAYRALYVELNNNSGLMNSATQRFVLNDFIRSFLSQHQNTGVDCTLPFNNSVDFILQNFGSFSPLAQLQDFSSLSRNFSAVDAVSVLTMGQLGELVFSPPARPEDRGNILTKVFDFLLQASNRDKLNNFLPALQTQARKANFRCENYRVIFDRMDKTLSSVAPNQSEALLTIRDSVMMIPPDECIERTSQCTTTPVNETVLCASVNSSAVDQFLSGAAPNTAGLCNFTVLQFACLPALSQLNSQQVADLLACKLSSNVTKETWKLFFTKTSTNLDDALLKFSNKAPSVSNVSLSDVLDVIDDVRISRLSPQRLKDPVFIQSWFQGRLKPFLPSVSQRLLSCLSTKNFTCESYRTIYVELNNNSGLMNSATQRFVLNDFIRSFLSRHQNTGVDCTLPFNNSVDFILQNFGSFSPLAQLQDFSSLSRNFSAVDAVSVLTMGQLGELVFSPPARPEDRGNILTKVFDFLLQASNRDKLNNFLPALQTQARKANFRCENYRVIFDRMDKTLSSVAPNQSEALLAIRDSVMMIPPDECIERTSQCTTTPVNETVLCASVNSSAVDQFLSGAAPNTAGLCNFTVLQFACLPALSQLNSQQVADLLACKLSSNVTKETWKLFFTKTSTNLDDALLKFSNKAPSVSNVSLSDVLDVIDDVRISRLSPQRLKDPVFIQSWFQGRLKPFLPSVSQRLLSCLSTKNFTCESYRTITTAFVNSPLRDGQDICNPLQPNGTQTQADLIYTNFMKAFLYRNDIGDPGCLKDTAGSVQWVNRTFGPFVQSASLKDLVALNKNFIAVDVLPLLSLRQLFEFSVTPGALTDPQSVINVMQHVKDCQLPAFFDLFSPKVQDILLTQDVRAALIKQIFDRASLSNPSITNQEVEVWIQRRLKPLLANLSESLVSPFFTILNTRDCNITQTALGLLDVAQPSLSINTTNAIYRNILQSIKGPQSLRCYRNNSFIMFLNESLYGFGPLPNVNTFLSLIPPTRKSEIVNSIAPSELGSYLRQPEVVNNDSQICAIFNSFAKTPEFLETEDVPDNVKSVILPCVWPLALTSDNETEADLWFNRRLKLYLKFLNKDLIGSNVTLSASCQSYKKMVVVLGRDFTFTGSQITTQDVYNTIKTYLKTDTEAKCYNASDARLNSTAWFVNNIGVFITLLTLDDLYSFGPESTMQIFAVNPDNIKLFNQKALPKKVISRYTELIFLKNPNFNLFDLPSVLQCDAPVSTFTKLNESETNVILGNFKTSCSDVDPAISSALARNIKTIDAGTITNLGSQVVGLTITQINLAPPSVLISSLSTLGSTSGWSLGQAKAIIGVLLSGDFKVDSSSKLLSLGSLIGGIPSTVLAKIQPIQILLTIQNTEFVKSILAAPEIVQKTFVSQIMKLGSTPSVLMTSIPSDLAVQIPRKFLEITTDIDTTVLQEFNTKKWKPEQAVLFFDSVANAFDQADDLSVEVLQGFTCSRVQKFTQTKVKGLIKACRRRSDRPKVVLSETQLTCMYNLIRKESPFDFENYHSDMLLYFNYETINKTLCKAYFTQVGAADLSVFSSTLSGRRDILLSNAIDCLGINRTSIKKKDLTVLGSLTCAVSGDVIKNSDPEILEYLKNCTDLSDSQMLAMQELLMKGTSKYGPKEKWNQKTLDDLDILPLYLSQDFWRSFIESDLAKFLKSFLKRVRGRNTPKPQLKKLFKAIIIKPTRAKRAASDCTKGNITSVTISDDAFPFGFDDVQFGHCLSSTVVRDNLASLCEKIEDSTFQRIILDKLREILPNGLSDDQVQVLKSVSRNATVEDISKWNITKSDTLAALMNANDGDWSSAQSELIITRYLSASNSLTATGLSLVKGPNLCSLNATVLSTILPESMRESDALDVSKCSSEKKKVLFTIANKAFPMSPASGQSAILSAFQLIETYLGGADLGYIRNLSSYSVSMSLSTFINLDTNVISNLTISDVVGLLGNNLQDLETFQNQTAVRSWISLQLQSELDKLNLSLTGGKATADTTAAAPSTSTTVTTKAATVKVTAGAPGIRASGWKVSFSILVFIITLIKVEII
ncbi:uncharacterized protein mslna [Onychostoma macrolepis]|nr:uncharacterized protein mslna [Onychostoma macrolepis]